jgi:4-amino-4-deoxy-L-arabinose transferase-like glycosyltransferase
MRGDLSGVTRRWLTASCLVSGLVLIVLLTVTATRLHRLSVLPPGLWYDEAYYALDAAWVADTRAAQVFFPGNNGREPLMPYLGAVSMSVLGQTPYALRLVSVLAAVLTVAMTYRWLVTMFADEPDRHWLGLIAAGGLALSFWYLVMSRTGHRAALLPACLVLTNWLFWRAFRCARLHGVGRSWPRWAVAGVALGVCQYSYLTARLVPLVFLIFGVVATVGANRAEYSRPVRRPVLWSGLAVMGLSAALVFAPLALYFLAHPESFFGRSGDVFVVHQIARGAVTWPQQLLDAVRVFVDGSDPHWRHNLADQSGFSLLESIGFWIGLLVCLRRLRRLPYSFLLVSLLVLWLPALLSVPAVYTLRLSGLLPVYYAVGAVGWMTVARGLAWMITRRTAWRGVAVGVRPAVTVLVLIATAWWALPAYFGRWAQTPMVYSQYNGPLADLAGYVAEHARDADILLPLPVYLHPTVHFLLRSQFAETEVRPPLRPDRPALLVEVPDIFLIPGVLAIDRQSSLMWLRRDPAGTGIAYLLHFPQPYPGVTPQPDGLADDLVVGPTQDRVATLYAYRTLASLVDAAVAAPPPVAVQYDWGHQVALTAYRLMPTLVQPGGATVLDLYWRGITDQPSEYRTFVHILDARGQPVSQVNGITLSEEQRWRRGRLSPEQHLVSLPAGSAAGVYLVRIGLIEHAGLQLDNEATVFSDGQASGRGGMASGRLPVYAADGRWLGDQLTVGLFYLADADGRDPRTAATACRGRFGDAIDLLGFSTLPCAEGAGDICIRLHWRSVETVERDYTAFLQLLDAQNRRVAGYDAQPLDGLYPTSRWQPGEVIISDFALSVPASLPSTTYRLVTGFYDLASGQRLPVTAVDGAERVDDALVLCEDIEA